MSFLDILVEYNKRDTCVIREVCPISLIKQKIPVIFREVHMTPADIRTSDHPILMLFWVSLLEMFNDVLVGKN